MKYMLSKIGSSLVIGGFFAILLYTTDGCAGANLTGPDIHFANLAGLVTDASTGSPVLNASVTARQRDSVTMLTTSDGRYIIGALDPGSVRVDVTKTGYQAFSTTKTLNEGSNTLDVQMRPSP